MIRLRNHGMTTRDFLLGMVVVVGLVSLWLVVIAEMRWR